VKTVAVMGSKNAGKTTVAEFLVERFVRDGLRVAAVKHIHHEFTIDTQGKDTWRLSKKGANIVASISPNEMAVMFYRFTGWNSSFETLKKILEGKVDVLVAEGFHMLLGMDEDVYKILTVKAVGELDEFLPRVKQPVLAVVNNTGRALHVEGLQVFALPLGEDFYRYVKERMMLT
jgi:molybdopterin-guanine dinucleotide biosynthesis protein B